VCFYFFVSRYGHIVPSTAAGRLAASVYMLVATTSVGIFLGTITELFVDDFVGGEIVDKIIDSTTWVHTCDLEKKGRVSLPQYMLFKLQQLQKVDAAVLDRLTDRFAQLTGPRPDSRKPSRSLKALVIGVDVPNAEQVREMQAEIDGALELSRRSLDDQWEACKSKRPQPRRLQAGESGGESGFGGVPETKDESEPSGPSGTSGTSGPSGESRHDPRIREHNELVEAGKAGKELDAARSQVASLESAKLLLGGCLEDEMARAAAAEEALERAEEALGRQKIKFEEVLGFLELEESRRAQAAAAALEAEKAHAALLQAQLQALLQAQLDSQLRAQLGEVEVQRERGQEPVPATAGSAPPPAAVAPGASGAPESAVQGSSGASVSTLFYAESPASPSHAADAELETASKAAGEAERKLAAGSETSHHSATPQEAPAAPSPPPLPTARQSPPAARQSSPPLPDAQSKHGAKGGEGKGGESASRPGSAFRARKTSLGGSKDELDGSTRSGSAARGSIKPRAARGGSNLRGSSRESSRDSSKGEKAKEPLEKDPPSKAPKSRPPAKRAESASAAAFDA